MARRAITRSQLAKAAKLFDELKVKRDSKGRFTDKPDAEKVKPPKKPRRTKAKPKPKVDPKQPKKNEWDRAIERVFSRMTPEQKQATLEALKRNTSEVKITAANRDLPVVAIKHKLVTKRENIAIKDGQVDIWRGTKYLAQDPTFKVRVDKQFNYQVEVDGKLVSLNRNRNVFEFKGEIVRGVPSLHPHLREMSNESLAKSLVSTMTMAERNPRAPKWDGGLHGQTQGIDNWTYDLGSKRGGKQDGYYGAMQIHHIRQWSNVDIPKFNRDLTEGKISKEEAQKMFDGAFKVNPDRKGTLDIKVLPTGVREFVILPAGLHDTNSSLFRANHPTPINPATGKKVRVGIPEKGKDQSTGSREWFDTQWKPQFWKEVYRRESFILQTELNRRLAKGDITPEQLSKIIDKARSDAIE